MQGSKGRESRSAPYHIVGCRDELSDATRVGDVPVSTGQGSLLEVASKYGVGSIGHSELRVHLALSPSDCGMSHTDLDVHVVSPPADCGVQPSPSPVPRSKDEFD